MINLHDGGHPLLLDGGDLEAGGAPSYCSSEYRPSPLPYALGAKHSWSAYGVRGGSPPSVTRAHNRAYAMGFNMAQCFMWYVLAPLSVPFALLMGMFTSGYVAFAQMVGWRPFCNLMGDLFGRMGLELSGKREYYEKKGAYFELAARDLQMRAQQAQQQQGGGGGGGGGGGQLSKAHAGVGAV